jgi:hypothetical protein
MQDNAPVIIAACGLATVCVGIFLVGSFLVVRFLGADLFSFIRGLPGLAKEERGNVNVEAAQRQARDRGDLRARAQSLDFDAAVAQYDPQNSQQGGTFGAQSAPRNAPPTSAPLSSGSRRPSAPSSPSGTASGWTTAGGNSLDDNTGSGSEDNPFGDVPRRRLRGDSRTSANDPRLKKRRRSGNDDEIFGGMLDDDGDGSVDF